MNGKSLKPHDPSQSTSACPPSGPNSDPYPPWFVFPTHALRGLDYDKRSATLLAQLCDVLIIVETAYAERFLSSPLPIKQCSVFLLEVLATILDEGRRTHQDFSPTPY